MSKPWKNAFAIALLVFSATTATLAQNAGSTGTSITQTFELRDLTNKPGKIVVGANVVTTLEFPANAVEVISGRPDLLIVQVSQVNRSRVLVRAAKTSGFTDLNISLATGETAIFSVSIDSKLTSSRRYIIKAAQKPASAPVTSKPSTPAVSSTPKPTPAPTATTTSTPASNPPAPSTATNAPASTTPAATATAPATPPPTPAPATDTKPTPEPTPDTKPAPIAGTSDGAFDATRRSGLTVLSLLPIDAKPAYEGRIPLPDWFGLYFRLTDINDAKRSASFEFTIENRGETTILADTAQLRVFVTSGRNRTPIAYSIADTNARATGTVMVKANQDYSSAITLDRLPEDETNVEIVLEWTLGAEGSDTGFLYRRTVQISLPPKAGRIG